MDLFTRTRIPLEQNQPSNGVLANLEAEAAQGEEDMEADDDDEEEQIDLGEDSDEDVGCVALLHLHEQLMVGMNVGY